MDGATTPRAHKHEKHETIPRANTHERNMAAGALQPHSSRSLLLLEAPWNLLLLLLLLASASAFALRLLQCAHLSTPLSLCAALERGRLEPPPPQVEPPQVERRPPRTVEPARSKPLGRAVGLASPRHPGHIASSREMAESRELQAALRKQEELMDEPVLLAPSRALPPPKPCPAPRAASTHRPRLEAGKGGEQTDLRPPTPPHQPPRPPPRVGHQPVSAGPAARGGENVRGRRFAPSAARAASHAGLAGQSATSLRRQMALTETARQYRSGAGSAREFAAATTGSRGYGATVPRAAHSLNGQSMPGPAATSRPPDPAASRLLPNLAASRLFNTQLPTW